MTQNNKLTCYKVAFKQYNVLYTKHQYLTPDYFLPSSSNAHYYSRKYRGILNLNFKSRIKQVATVSLIFLSMVTGEVFAGDTRLKSTASSGRKQEATFETITLSNNLPDVVPQLPLPDLIPSNPPVTPPPPPPMPPLPDIVPPVILPDVVPNPAAPPPMPDLLGDSGSSMPKQKTGFMAAMKQIAKGNFKLKKVKPEPKVVVVSGDNMDLMSQILARREAITGEKQDNKFKKADKEVIVLTAEEQKAREAEISQKIAANKEKAATLRKQKEKEWAIKAKQIEAEVEIEKQRKAAEHAKAMREQKAKESGSDSSIVIAGIDPVLHNNIVADLRQEISALKEQLTLKGNDNAEGINDLGSNGNARSKRSLEDRLYDEKLEHWEFEGDEAVKKLDEVISTYSDSDSGYDDEALADSSDRGSSNSLETNDVVSAAVLQSNSIVSEIVQDELSDVEKELQSQKLKEGESVEAVEDILSEDLMTDTGGSPADANHSTARHQEVLAERTGFAARIREDLRFGSKAISKQIRHRLLTRDIGSMLAVSAGDEEELQAPSYSIWSSGILVGSKQKAISAALGYSSRIHGGSIGGEINLSSDLMFGVSYSRLSSKIKYPSMLNAGSNVSRTNADIFSIYNGTTLAENTNLQLLASVALSGKHGKKQDIVIPKSKLFSFESHLNQNITWGNNITLIPSIGFRYEYGRIGASSDIILDSYTLHHKKSKSSTLSGEVGARVLFMPIKLSHNFQLVPTAHISLEKRIASTGGKRGQLISVKDIGGEASVVSSNTNHAKLSTNIGGGLIASHKNISLECLYDMQKQRSFKSHQGVLKLKVNL